MSGPEVVASVERLVEVAELEAIDTYRLVAERDIFARKPDNVEIDPVYKMTIDFRDDASGFRVRLETDIATPLGKISCAVLSDYGLGEARIGAETSEAITEFINNVALMHLIPYTRQAIADLTQRVFSAPLLMPMIQRGQINFTPDAAEHQQTATAEPL